MLVKDILQSLGETFSSSATVKSVYGEPVTAGERTVIPVARVRFGFGGGGSEGASEEKSRGGGGGGGSLRASPYGLIEITPVGTRLIRFEDPQVLAVAVAAGVLLGYLAGRLTRKSD
jgi:uncharacterized spore protein YtfJ